MSEWRKHVKKTYDEMKNKDSKVLLKHALKAASKTWKKKTQKKGGNCGMVDTKKEEEEKMGGEEEGPMGEEEVGSMDEKVGEDVAGGTTSKTNMGGKKSKKSKKGGKTKKNRKSKKSEEDSMDPKYL